VAELELKRDNKGVQDVNSREREFEIKRVRDLGVLHNT
jgi:hypothetical protein